MLRDIFKHSKGMSRGDREAATGILKGSMRDNYTEHGVDEVRLTLAFSSFSGPELDAEALTLHSTTRRSARHTVIRTFRESKTASFYGSTGASDKSLQSV